MWEEKIRNLLLTFFFVSLPLSIAVQQAALGLLLVFLAYRSWQNKQIPRSPLDWPLFVFFAALLLSSLLSPAVLSSLLGLRKLWLMGAAWAVYHLLREPREVERLVSLMLIVTVGVAVYGIIQHFTGIDLAKRLVGKAANVTEMWIGGPAGFRTEGFFPTGITYAHNLCFPLTLLTVWLLSPNLRWRERLLLSGGWGLMLLALLFSLTRGAWVAYLGVLGLLGVIKGGKGLVILGGSVVGITLLLLTADATVRERLPQVLNLGANLNRQQIWQANFDMIKERPLSGWGYGNYKKFRELYYRQYPAADTHAHAHNNFLQVWVDGGLMSLLAFLYLLWRVLRLGWRAYRSLPTEAEPLRSLSLGGALSIGGFLLGGITQYNLGDAEVAIVFWAMIGVLMRMAVWAEEWPTRTGAVQSHEAA